jgi:hypothetical protein
MGFGAANQAANYLTLHGTQTQLHSVAVAIARDWPVLTSTGPLICEPIFGCHHLHLVVIGVFESADLDRILAALRIATSTVTVLLP